jgi:hypothetical protein
MLNDLKYPPKKEAAAGPLNCRVKPSLGKPISKKLKR